MHYGNVSLREALGNSLNIPAIKTIQFTGNDDFLQFLKQAGFNSLTEPAEHYGEGLALGNGEVTLFELVQAYTALATRGIWRPLNVRKTGEAAQTQARARAIMTAETSSIIAHILSDPYARRLEFGAEGVLRLPVQTAVKTGTSTGYRDAWAIGYSHNFVVGVWLGNLDNSPMREISGARGPALVLRSIFAHLEGLKESRDLYQSQLLTRHTICPTSGMLAGTMCQHVSELFVAGSEPSSMCTLDHTLTGSATYATRNATAKSLHPERARIALPSHGLHLALDPRIPDSHEMFGFELESPQPITGITWIVDGESVATYRGDIRRHLWQLKRGRHTVRARVSANVGQPEIETDGVEFFVR
jgi:penicillin-binding protein 1C